jgi:MerR family transcriptional regulator, copper efflux regulator
MVHLPVCGKVKQDPVRSLRSVQIGELASRAQVPAKTIRYWETLGVLTPAGRKANGYRDYDPGVVDRLAFVRAAQASGLTLNEIRSIVGLRDGGETPCDHVRQLIEHRKAELDAQIADLERLRVELGRLADRASELDPADCDPTGICHIITTPGHSRTPDR